MENLSKELCAILEVDSLQLDIPFEKIPEWDSLNALSVISLLDSRYGIHMDAIGLKNFKNIQEFIEYVLSQRK